MSEISARKWRVRFITLDLFYGLAWMFILINPVGVDENSGTFMLFVMLLVVAVSSMLASSLPMAAFAATFRSPAPSHCILPAGHAARLHPRHHGADRAGLFRRAGYRLYSTTLATLHARAEKDALIGELEQAKAISDEARKRAKPPIFPSRASLHR